MAERVERPNRILTNTSKSAAGKAVVGRRLGCPSTKTIKGEGIEVQKALAYYRVSTREQSNSGLGLQGQQTAVEEFVARHNYELIGCYREVESGKRADRPELAKCLAHARRTQARVIISKLDRLSRSVAFLSQLMENKTSFIAVDMPEANEFCLHLMVAVAEFERKAISARTCAALAEARRGGVLLGSHRPGHWDGREALRLQGLEKARTESAKSCRRTAAAAYEDLLPLMVGLRANGLTYQQISDHLNELGHTTSTGRCWHHSQTRRVLGRAS